jgi:hypothetical protein
LSSNFNQFRNIFFKIFIPFEITFSSLFSLLKKDSIVSISLLEIVLNIKLDKKMIKRKETMDNKGKNLRGDKFIV